MQHHHLEGVQLTKAPILTIQLIVVVIIFALSKVLLREEKTLEAALYDTWGLYVYAKANGLGGPPTVRKSQ